MKGFNFFTMVPGSMLPDEVIERLIVLGYTNTYFEDALVDFRRIFCVESFLLLGIFIIFIFALLKSTKGAELMQTNVIKLSIFILIICLYFSSEFNFPLSINIYWDHNLHFIDDTFINFIKVIILVLSIFLLLVGLSYTKISSLITYEFLTIFLISVWSMVILVSVRDLIVIYLILELQSFCFYIITASKNKSNFSTEAGLKYFVLGSVSSGFLLFGISLLYGLTGLTNLHDLQVLFLVDNNISDHILILNLSLILIFISILFKLGLAPFHMYLPDVYTGAPSFVTMIFIIIQKLIILIVYFNLYITLFKNFYDNLHYILIFSILLSLLIGSVTALAQFKIKRLVAYSAIVNSGFLMLGIYCGTLDGITSSLVCLFIYIILMFTLFSIYLSLRYYYNNSRLSSFKDLIVLKKSNLALAICFSLVLFSIAGIPPLAGFFGKLFLFISLIQERFYLVSIIAVLFTVITAYYYIKLIKVMFFEKTLKFAFLYPVSKVEAYFISLGTLLNLTFFIMPKILLLHINIVVTCYLYILY